MALRCRPTLGRSMMESFGWMLQLHFLLGRFRRRDYAGPPNSGVRGIRLRFRGRASGVLALSDESVASSPHLTLLWKSRVCVCACVPEIGRELARQAPESASGPETSSEDVNGSCNGWWQVALYLGLEGLPCLGGAGPLPRENKMCKGFSAA
jgi:hypothetical protein